MRVTKLGNVEWNIKAHSSWERDQLEWLLEVLERGCAPVATPVPSAESLPNRALAGIAAVQTAKIQNDTD